MKAAKPRKTQPAGRDAIAAWHAEHVSFLRLLDVLEKELEAFRSGRRPDYERMLEVVSTLRHYGDRFHHPLEDAAFARLAQRRPDLVPVLDSLGQEHRIIATAGERLQRLVNGVLDDSVVDRHEIEMAAGTYLVYYRAHIGYEEEHVLADAAKSLTAEDWRAVRRLIPVKGDASGLHKVDVK